MNIFCTSFVAFILTCFVPFRTAQSEMVDPRTLLTVSDKVIKTETIKSITFETTELVETSVPSSNLTHDNPPKAKNTYPQIINPTATQKIWNTSIKSYTNSGKTICDGKPGESSVKINPEYVTDNFISIRIKNWFYCHGAPHGYGGDFFKNTLLSENNREFKPDELFKPDVDWHELLLKYSLEALTTDTKSTSSVNERNLKSARDDISKGRKTYTVAILKQGLRTDFGNVLGYAGGRFYAVIPWKTLSPYLRKDIPFDLPQP